MSAKELPPRAPSSLALLSVSQQSQQKKAHIRAHLLYEGPFVVIGQGIYQMSDISDLRVTDFKRKKCLLLVSSFFVTAFVIRNVKVWLPSLP